MQLLPAATPRLFYGRKLLAVIERPPPSTAADLGSNILAARFHLPSADLVAHPSAGLKGVPSRESSFADEDSEAPYLHSYVPLIVRLAAYTRETDEKSKVLGFAGWKAREPKAGVFEL